MNGTNMHPDCFGCYRADIFAAAASGTPIFVNSDSCSRDEHDCPRFAAVNTGKAAAIFCQAVPVVGPGHTVFIGHRCVGLFIVIRQANGRLLRFRSNPAGLQQGFPEGEKALFEEVLAGERHFFFPLAAFFAFFTSPCTWHEVQLSRSGWLVGGAFLTPSRWQALHASPS